MFLAAVLVVTSCSADGGDVAPATTTSSVPALLTEAECEALAVDAAGPLQAFVDEFDQLAVVEWNALDPPPDIAAAQDEAVALAQAAVDRGCSADRMEELLAEAVDRIEGQGEVGRAIAAALRGDGPFLGPPEPVISTTVPRDRIPTTVTLEVGSSLRELLAHLAPGSTIRFASGTHTFNEPIIVDVDVHFEGAGEEETILSSSAQGVALQFVGPGGFTLSDLTLEHTGATEASVLLAIEGPLSIDHATIRGGVAGPDQTGGGHGVVFAYENLPGFPARTDLERAGSLSITDSTITGNEAAGVLVNGTASPRLDGVTISDNGTAGILVSGSAAPKLDGVSITGNGGCGLCYNGDDGGTVANSSIESNEIGAQIGADARPRLTDNRYFGNTNVGISVDGDASPVIENSTIEENGNVGIQIAGSSDPTVDKNTVRQHGVGVLVADTARPNLSDNGIVDHEFGVQVGGEAVAELVDNVIWLSSVVAVSFAETSSGSIRDNRIDKATEVGIQLIDEADVEITGNLIEHEGTVGISYLGASKGSATGNEITGRDVGIQVGGTASPRLIDNTVHDSVSVGVLFGDAATGLAKGNDVSGAEAVGMLSGGTSRPEIRENVITENSVGLVFRERSGATVTGNTIDRHPVGVQLLDQSNVLLEGNTITNGVEAGVVFAGSATGTLRRNSLEANGNISIQIAESAHPVISGNEIRGESIYAVAYRDQASGEFSDNRVINFVFGLELSGSADPQLYDNRLEEIELTNITYKDSSGGEIRGNTCTQSFVVGININAPANPNVGENDCTVSRS